MTDLGPVRPVPDPRLLAGCWLVLSAACVVGLTHAFGPLRPTALAQLQAHPRFFAEMLGQGVYLAPSAYEAMFVSLAHTEDDIARTIEAARTSFRRVE